MRADAIFFSTEGVLVAKKDFNLPKHPEIDTKNLYVYRALHTFPRHLRILDGC